MGNLTTVLRVYIDVAVQAVGVAVDLAARGVVVGDQQNLLGQSLISMLNVVDVVGKVVSKPLSIPL